MNTHTHLKCAIDMQIDRYCLQIYTHTSICVHALRQINTDAHTRTRIWTSSQPNNQTKTK